MLFISKTVKDRAISGKFWENSSRTSEKIRFFLISKTIRDTAIWGKFWTSWVFKDLEKCPLS